MTVSEKRQTIVIADDDAFLREMLRLLLRSDDYEVIGEAANGAIAFDLCRKLRPDVALLDINMPIKDGLSVLEELKSLNCPSKVVMMSTEATLDRVKLAVAKGAKGFIVKPFSAASVLNELRERLQ